VKDETPKNPYQSPTANDKPPPVSRPDIPTIIAIALLSLLAAAGAFFGTCVGTVIIAMGLGVVTLHNGPDNLGAILYGISTIAAVVAAIRVFQWRYRKETVSGTISKPASDVRARVAIDPVSSRDALKMHGGGNAAPQIADSVTETPPNPYERPATHNDLSPVRRPDTPTFIAIVLWSLVAAASTFFATCLGFHAISPAVQSVGIETGQAGIVFIAFVVCIVAAVAIAFLTFRNCYRNETDAPIRSRRNARKMKRKNK